MPDAAPPTAPGIDLRVVLSTAVGNALEFYDFVVYSFFSVYLARAFFPPDVPGADLLAALAVFGVGFLARPLGALVMAQYADRRGRRPALLLSMALMAVSTLAIAALPGYAQLGVAAPMLLVTLRLVQGFAYGAEIGPATAYLMEMAPPSKVGLYCASLFAGQGAAACLAGLLGSTLAASLDPLQMQAWGWRLPFAAGLLLMPLALYLRRRMRESLMADARRPSSLIAASPAGRPDWRTGLQLMTVLLGGTVANYMFTYLSTYAATVLKVPMPQALMTATVVGALTFVFGLLGGLLSDRWGRRPVLIGSRLACTVLALPAFLMMTAHPDAWTLWIIAGGLSALNALTGGAVFAAIPESFPLGHRARAMALVYASGVALFGGSTPFISAWLVQRTGDPVMPGWYMTATGALALLATWRLKESRPQDSCRPA